MSASATGPSRPRPVGSGHGRTPPAVLAAAGGGIGALVALGPPAIEPTPAAAVDPAATVAAWSWWVAVIVLAYLALVAALAVAAQLTDRRLLAGLARRLCVPALRSFVLPVTLAGGRLLTAVPAVATTSPPPPPPPLVMTADDAPATGPLVMTAETAPAFVAQILADRVDAPLPADPAPPHDPAAPPTPPTTAPAATQPTVHEVRGGEHCWSIAEDEVRRRLGRTPTVAEVADYWRRLLALNHDRFATGDPDLIFPGQELLLP